MALYAPFYFLKFAKMKFTTEKAYQRNSFETAQQNFVKLCSFKGHNVLILSKLHILLKQFVSGTPLNPPNRIT